MESALHFRSPERPPAAAGACVGVFDSGVGGLSVLRALRDRLPDAPLLYVADSAHAPYGERSEAHVIERSRRIVRHLVDAGAVGVVIACNTATAIAVRTLRDEWPALPIIGVEPGLKPAAAITGNGRVGVMATSGTLASDKFRQLMQTQQAGGVTIVPRPCPGLARLIEQGDLEAPALRAAIEEHAAFLRGEAVDTVVLGCTHYAFVRHHIERAMGPAVRLVDTADAVARHAAERLGHLVVGAAPGSARLGTTGDASRLRVFAKAWLGFACVVERVDESALSWPTR